jgi:hypothetical protein
MRGKKSKFVLSNKINSNKVCGWKRELSLCTATFTIAAQARPRFLLSPAFITSLVCCSSNLCCWSGNSFRFLARGRLLEMAIGIWSRTMKFYEKSVFFRIFHYINWFDQFGQEEIVVYPPSLVTMVCYCMRLLAYHKY